MAGIDFKFDQMSIQKFQKSNFLVFIIELQLYIILGFIFDTIVHSWNIISTSDLNTPPFPSPSLSLCSLFSILLVYIYFLKIIALQICMKVKFTVVYFYMHTAQFEQFHSTILFSCISSLPLSILFYDRICMYFTMPLHFPVIFQYHQLFELLPMNRD